MRMRSMLLCLAVSMWSAEAAVVVTPVVTGGFSYDYTITNTEPFGIIQVQLTLPVDPTSVSAPTDWVFNTFSSGSDTIVQWASETAEISSGGSLSGFIIESPFGPVSVAFEVTDTELNTSSGTTQGPGSAIPEPATFTLTALSFGALPLIRRWRERKA
jgi:hypothetical protein